jgi:hypothetical protein
MKFTIKTAMIGLGLTSVLVAALFSGSSLFLGLLTSVVLMLIPMMLVFAICDGRKSRRPFWIGSFIMSLTCICGSQSFGVFSPIDYEIAHLICTVGSPTVAQVDASNPSPAVFGVPAIQPIIPAPSGEFQPVVPVYPAFSPTAVPVGFGSPVYISSSYDEHFQAVAAFVPIFFSVLAGVCGGLAALWISHVPKGSEAKQEEDPELTEDESPTIE